MTDFQHYDTNGDTYGDVLAADTDGNGRLDTYAGDADRDGYNELLMIDSNENGTFDMHQMDTDLNGTADTTFYDTNENGMFDHVQGPATGNQLMTLQETPSRPAPILSGPGVIGGGGHDPLIDLLEHATPQQADIIMDMLDSKQDVLDNLLDDDDDDD